MLFRVRLYLRRLLLCFLYPSHSVPSMDLQLTSVLFSRNIFLVVLPISMVHFSLIVFSVGLSVTKVSVEILPNLVSPRGMISVFFVFFGGFKFSIASTFSSIGLIPFSFISCPSHFVWFKKNSDFLLLARYPAFSSLFNISNSFLSWSCLLPRVTTIMSSSHAGVLYSSVWSIFSWNVVGLSARP